MALIVRLGRSVPDSFAAPAAPLFTVAHAAIADFRHPTPG
jgi:hypothetical protein